MSINSKSMILYKLNTMTLCVAVICLLMSLSGCATGPAERLEIIPAKPAKLSVKVQPGPSFQRRMRDFLRGKLPEPTPSEGASLPATPHLTQ